MALIFIGAGLSRRRPVPMANRWLQATAGIVAFGIPTMLVIAGISTDGADLGVAGKLHGTVLAFVSVIQPILLFLIWFGALAVTLSALFPGASAAKASVRPSHGESDHPLPSR
jgi:hypothetical protein